MDLLIRDVPEEVVAALDGEAKRLGLSRSELLRRALHQLVPQQDRTLTVEQLATFEQTFAGLADPGVMDRAWE
jgi:hypothetical protein